MFNSFLRLSAGNILGGLTSIVALLLLPHFYSPSNVGTYFLSLSIATLISIFISQGRDPVFVSVKSDLQAQNLIFITIRLLIRNAIYIYFVAFFIKQILKSRFFFSFMEMLLILIIASVYSIFGILYYFTLRHENFQALSFRGPIQNLSIFFLQMLGSFLYPSVYMLLFAEVVGRLVGIFPLYRFFVTQKKASNNQVNDLSVQASTTKIISRYMFPSNLIEASLMVILLGVFNSRFGSEALGQLSWALRLCTVPISMFGISLGQVYLASFTRALSQSHDLLVQRFRKQFFVVVVFSVLSFFLLLLVLPFLLKLYTVPGWELVWKLAQQLAFFSASKFAWDALGHFYNVTEMWRQYLYATILRLFALIFGITYTHILKASFVKSVGISFSGLALAQTFLLIFIYIRVCSFFKSD